VRIGACGPSEGRNLDKNKMVLGRRGAGSRGERQLENAPSQPPTPAHYGLTRDIAPRMCERHIASQSLPLSLHLVSFPSPTPDLHSSVTNERCEGAVGVGKSKYLCQSLCISMRREAPAAPPPNSTPCQSSNAPTNGISFWAEKTSW
jgi:hypothetical protein